MSSTVKLLSRALPAVVSFALLACGGDGDRGKAPTGGTGGVSDASSSGGFGGGKGGVGGTGIGGFAGNTGGGTGGSGTGGAAGNGTGGTAGAGETGGAAGGGGTGALLWNGDLSTGDLSQLGGWEYGGTFDGTPPLSQRVAVGASIDGINPPGGPGYLMKVTCAPGDQYGSSTGWRTLGRQSEPIQKRDAGYDSYFVYAVYVPAGWPGDANVWLAGREWHHTGTTVAPSHAIIYGDHFYVDVFGGDQNNKTTYVQKSFWNGYEKNKWYVLCEHYKHGLAPNGAYALWGGKMGTDTQVSQIVDSPNIGTMYSGYSNYLLFGTYRAQTGSSTNNIYFARMREYATEASAIQYANSILAGP